MIPIPLTIIAGPTASGKTSLAIEVAKRLDAEIVSADSQQVYRLFDIGTAKPSAAELAQVPHHLISCLDPMEQCSAPRFLALADDAIAQIHSRKRRVVIAGGTGLYLRVLLHGVVAAPPGSEALRAELEAFADAYGNEALHARLAKVDPVSAAKLPVPDRLRVLRALEIHELTGKAASEHRAEHAFAPSRYPYSLWILDPPRNVLYEGINARTQAMFDAGLLDETRALIAQGYRQAPPMSAVGYVQAVAVIEGRMTLAEAIADCAQKTRNYAKRQYTWFRKEQGGRHLVPPYPVEQLVLSARDC